MSTKSQDGHDLVLQQPQCPACTALGGLGTSQSDQLGFLLAVHILSQVEAIERLTREVEVLRADNAKLRAKLNLPSKTPENSSTPPSQGHKVSGEERKTPEGKRRNSHAGGTSDKARTL
ncbi:MAG TPA: hypothetical protein VHF01_01855 [Candidatus Acidoferrum sp.]|nr:hypothetical protein [Candidatus Acidoferrum sp.]